MVSASGSVGAWLREINAVEQRYRDRMAQARAAVHDLCELPTIDGGKLAPDFFVAIEVLVNHVIDRFDADTQARREKVKATGRPCGYERVFGDPSGA